MSEKPPQTFANHGRFDPWFHFLILPGLLICFGFAISFVVHRASSAHIWTAAFSLLVFLLAGRCRVYALKVQDRVIRLEERLRLSALAPEALRVRLPELSERQLIALRFASDGEAPMLVERTLREGLEPKAIKQAIQNWRPDDWRV